MKDVAEAACKPIDVLEAWIRHLCMRFMFVLSAQNLGLFHARWRKVGLSLLPLSGLPLNSVASVLMYCALF